MGVVEMLNLSQGDYDVLQRYPVDDQRRVGLVKKVIDAVMCYVCDKLDDSFRQMAGRRVLVMDPTQGELERMLKLSDERARALGVDLGGMSGGNGVTDLMRGTFGAKVDFDLVKPGDVGTVSPRLPSVSLGSMTSVLGPPDDAVLTGVTAFVRRCIDNELPLLAVCFSAQVLAQVVGGVVQQLPTGLRLGLVDVVRAEGADSILEVLSGERVCDGKMFAAHSDGIVDVPESKAHALTGRRGACDGMIVVDGKGPLFGDGRNASAVIERMFYEYFLGLGSQVHWDTSLRRFLECVIENKEQWWEMDLEYLVAKLSLMMNMFINRGRR